MKKEIAVAGRTVVVWEGPVDRQQIYVAPEHGLAYLSFIDEGRPKGDQFVGAALVEVPQGARVDAETEEGAVIFVAAAVEASRRARCNPGGRAAVVQIPAGMQVPRELIGVLLTRAQVDELDAGHPVD